MPTQGPSGRPTTRRYSDEEKAQAVRLVRRLRVELGVEHGTVNRVAEQLGYGVESVRSWVRQADIDAGTKPGATTSEFARIAALEQENRELRRANDIPKKGIGFFRGGARPPIEMIAAFIDGHRDEFGVEPICRAVQMAPSTYYAVKHRQAVPSERTVRDAVWLPILTALWVANRRVYGAHKLWLAAKRAGHEIGRDHVARLMRTNNIGRLRTTHAGAQVDGGQPRRARIGLPARRNSRAGVFASTSNWAVTTFSGSPNP